jgi:hypothetical protein
MSAVPQVEVGGYVEAGVVANEFRKAAGGEFGVGEYTAGLELGVKYGPVWARLEAVAPGVVCDWQNEPDGANQHWLRANGYESRPWLLPEVGGQLEVGEHRVSLRLGGLLAGGLGGLWEGRYYLETPPPLLHTQHWDKGFELGWEWRGVEVRVACVDGDWAIGERDLFALHNSANNSYPSWGWTAQVDLVRLVAPAWSEKIGAWLVGCTGTEGDLGSYPGQKRRQENVVVWGAVRRPV